MVLQKPEKNKKEEGGGRKEEARQGLAASRALQQREELQDVVQLVESSESAEAAVEQRKLSELQEEPEQSGQPMRLHRTWLLPQRQLLCSISKRSRIFVPVVRSSARAEASEKAAEEVENTLQSRSRPS